jgi:hypothetical protein
MFGKICILQPRGKLPPLPHRLELLAQKWYLRVAARMGRLNNSRRTSKKKNQYLGVVAEREREKKERG